MQTIFREIKQAHELIKGTEYEDLRSIALQELEIYINSMRWYEGRDKEEFIKHYRLPVDEYAKRTGKGKDNIHLIIKRASDKIRDRLGYNRIHTIIHGTKEEVEMFIAILKWGTKSYIIDRIVLPEVANLISQYRVTKEYTLEELEEEAKFLNEYSYKTLNYKMKRLNKEKLSYIVQLLVSKDGADQEKKVILLNKIQDVMREELKNENLCNNR